MIYDSSRFKTRQKAKNSLKQLLHERNRTIAIHYSCESFYDRTDGSSPRITSIGVRNLENGQTTSFSIHQIAEIHKADLNNMASSYNTFEKEMLDQFYRYVEAHKEYSWLHWNMRDINYGFPAIAHRYRVLGGTPIDIHDSNLFDLARILVSLLGPQYTNHPRLTTFMKMNNISDLNFLSGQEEADAFDRKEYVKLHQSTLRKIDTFDTILDRLERNSFKHQSTKKEVYGGYLGFMNEFIREHWIIAILMFISTIVGLFTAFK
jgi:hypothetical protein